MLKIMIHRGSHQIGGSATEIECDGKRILIDLGANLPGLDEKAAITDKTLLKRVFGKENERKFEAILFSHYHGDHLGLYRQIPMEAGIPTYIGAIAKDIMKIVTKTIDSKDADGMARLENMQTYTSGSPIVFADGKITVTPYQVDHSALDAYMFLIEADNTRILFTGDFREHGITSENNELWNTVDIIARKPVDVLITEGTMLSRDTETKNNSFRTEADLGKKAAEIFANKPYNFVVVSSTNFDSIMEFYHNTPKDKLFICDAYQAKLIATAYRGMHDKNNMYRGKKESYLSKHIYVYEQNERKAKLAIMAANEIASSANKDEKNPLYFNVLSKDMLEKGFVMLIRPNHFSENGPNKFEELLWEYREKDKANVNVIYSMWEGYLEEEHKDKDLVRLVGGKSEVISLHTSGHAYIETIADLMKKVKPRTIIPMHTEMADSFRHFKEFKAFKKNVVVLHDGKRLKINNQKIVRPAPKFKRKTNYSDKVKREIQVLWKAFPELLILPSTSWMIGYCKGCVLVEKITDRCFNVKNIDSSDRETSLKEFTKEFFNKASKAYGEYLEGDKERRSSQLIALQNMDFKYDEYSVCGWETTIPLSDLFELDKEGAPEIDMILVNPKEETILFVEYKCAADSMLSKEQNIKGHYKDYRTILDSYYFDNIKNEMLKTYAFLYELKNNRAFDYKSINWKSKIAFLFVDKADVDGGEGLRRVSEITQADYDAALLRKDFKPLFNDDEVLYIRAPYIDENTELKLNHWEPLKGSNLRRTKDNK